MKKVIPQKIVNIVYRKLLANRRKEKTRLRSYSKNWREELFYRSPESNDISNRFFKNKVSVFINVDRDDWWFNGRVAYIKKQMDKVKEAWIDYEESNSTKDSK